MNYYIIFIFIIKILFLYFAITTEYYTLKIKKDPKNKEYLQKQKTNLYWKDRFEFIFIILMSFLLLNTFNPRSTKPIFLDFETKLLLCIYAIVILITANWQTFIGESPELKYLQSIN